MLMKTNKGFAPIAIVLIIIAVLAVGGIAYYAGKSPIPAPQNTPATTTVSMTLPIPYISAQSGWPPVIKNSEAAYSCVTGSYGPIQILEGPINGKKYCIKIIEDGAAGSIYHTYTYTTANGNSTTKETVFTLRYVQCGNYSEPQQTECKKAQLNFFLNAFVDSLMK